MELFWDTGVAYDFVLEAEEKNNINTEVNFLRLISGNTGTLGLKAGLDRTRSNTRTFTLTDTFSKLVSEIPPHYCDGRVVEENIVYPMAGKVGIDKVLRDFVNLTLFANLAPRDSAKQPDGPPTYVVALDFETSISGSATPKVEFSPVRSVSDASLAANVSRKDTHKLTLGFAIAKGSLARVTPLRSAFFIGPLLTASATTRSEAAAVDAVSQFKANNIFGARRAIVISQ
ncbi:hypothetical protein DWF00_10630 [Bosea caraganae]|uniref:Uncharacterized protein n=1 Tax=Bosea caraganae TaxID=2763117 RepID=A0A370LBS0_9HYPH|nr:hypothetical protein DWF00_10630 [Bosea caraganae]RDJ29422.1 hypothetical protein DWE98_02400 [Bosea caraganae]